MSSQLFRAEAMEKHASPDQLDKLLQVAGPRDWLWLSALLLLATSLVLWAFLGKLPREVNAEGVIDHSRGIPNVVTPMAGLVQDVLVKRGDTVAANQVAVTLYSPDGALHNITVPAPAVVSTIWVHPEMYVQPGTVLMNLGQRLHAYTCDVYVNAADALSVKPGMSVRCAPYTVRPEVYGFALGHVIEVSPVLSTQAEMESTVRDPEMVQRLRQREMVHHLVLQLALGDTVSGLEWSGGVGPPWKLTEFGRCRVTVLLGERRPIELFLPSLGATNP